jgi:hypothetical protein
MGRVFRQIRRAPFHEEIMSDATAPEGAQAALVTSDAPTDAPKVTKPAKASKTAPLPDSVTLAAPHGFYDEAGDLQAWLAGEVVTAKAEIKLLIERGARLLGINGEQG